MLVVIGLFAANAFVLTSVVMRESARVGEPVRRLRTTTRGRTGPLCGGSIRTFAPIQADERRRTALFL
ncbi:MAG: hypothetical protein C4320_00425 [Armatimonadota bacterium]